jgi:glutamate racemase
MNKKPIGVFDSGVGGLTVLKELKALLPEEEFIYFGDTARVPYGTKSKKTVTHFASQIMDFLITKNVKMVVAACNTVSSNSIYQLRRNYDIPVVGVIEPGVELALRLTKNGHIGIIGTQGTINSHKYKDLLLKKDKSLKIVEKFCPLFVPLVEEGLSQHQLSQMAIDHYLRDFKKRKIDTLVLGCTHYPLLMDSLQKYFGKSVNLVNSGYAVSLKVKEILKSKKILSSSNHKKKISFYLSDLSDGFLNVAKSALKLNELTPKVVSLD